MQHAERVRRVLDGKEPRGTGPTGDAGIVKNSVGKRKIFPVIHHTDGRS
jgi:hypothetical protein